MNTQKKRLRYQSWHRGCKETDDILGPFADMWLEKTDDVSLFEALLEEDDRDIYRWLTEAQPVPDEYIELMAEIMSFQQNKVKSA